MCSVFGMVDLSNISKNKLRTEVIQSAHRARKATSFLLLMSNQSILHLLDSKKFTFQNACKARKA